MVSEYFCFLCHHPTKAAHSSSSQYCSHQPDKGEKSGNLNTKKSTFENIALERKALSKKKNCDEHRRKVDINMLSALGLA